MPHPAPTVSTEAPIACMRVYDGASEAHRSAIGKRVFQRAVQP